MNRYIWLLSVGHWQCEGSREEMWTFSKFLCCLKLETGGYVIGFLGMFASLLSILGLIGLLCVKLDDVIDYVHYRFRVLDDVKIPIVSEFFALLSICHKFLTRFQLFSLSK